MNISFKIGLAWENSIRQMKGQPKITVEQAQTLLDKFYKGCPKINNWRNQRDGYTWRKIDGHKR